MSKRKVLIVGNGSLFGQGMGSLLGAQGADLQIEQAPTIDAAIEAMPRVRPDTVVFCMSHENARDEAALQRLRTIDAYPPRIVRCTLDANHLTIYDTTRIRNATVEDLVAAVLRGGSDEPMVNGREDKGGESQ